MEIHKLLKRQLNRAQLSDSMLPNNLENWQEFINRLDKTYREVDQEHYLLGRSMEISSREMMQLNEKLEQAQHTAGMGSWYYNRDTEQVIWSKELYTLFNLNPLAAPPSYEEFLRLVHKDDRNQLKQLVEKALSDHINYRYEFRAKAANGSFRWFRTIAHCEKKPNQLSGIVIDINKDKEAEEKIQQLNQQLLATARRAGMSEVATSILHNVGNILNSSNVSLNILRENLAQPYYSKLFKLIDMIEEHRSDKDYFTLDDKGRLIPEYLIALNEILIKDYKQNLTEIKNLTQDLQHLNNIVATQQSLSGISGITEKIFLPEVIDTALQMSVNPNDDKCIKIIKNYEKCPIINTDKSKLLQILVNLIRNAKHSVLEKESKEVKMIMVVLKVINDKQHISIEICDNGIGIPPVNLNRIFTFGFTTKEQGHGFGLHSCALSTQELGGSIRAESLGIGKGASFFLILPMDNLKGKGVFNE